MAFKQFAIGVILVALVLIALVSVMTPVSNTLLTKTYGAGECLFQGSFPCNWHRLLTNGTVEIEIENGRAYGINVIQFMCTLEKTEEPKWAETPYARGNFYIRQGSTGVLTSDCYSRGGRISGEPGMKAELFVFIRYIEDSGSAGIAAGTIRAEFENASQPA